MKKTTILIILLSFISLYTQAQTTVFMNEINYLVTPTSDRGIGIAGPANTDLSGWQVALYDENGLVYSTSTIPSNTQIDNEGAGYGEIWYPMPNLTNTNNVITVAIIDATPTVQQVLTWSATGTTITPQDGSAMGVTSTGVTALQVLSTQGIQLVGTGTEYEDFTGWVTNVVSSDGSINTLAGQNFSALPVELMNFNSSIINNQIELNWSTATEENNDYFIVEKSLDGQSFSEIGKVQGAGTTAEQQDYRFIDETPKLGWNYYRLKQVDFNGVFEYSTIISIYHFDKNSITLYPNPLSKGAALQIENEFDKPITIQIINTNGQLMIEKEIQTSTTSIPLELSTGVYIYQIIENGQILKTDRLVIID